jgi:hypothetical protein
VSARATEVLRYYEPFVVPSRQPNRLRGGDVAVEETVRKEDKVGGEAVATDVAAFPNPVGKGGSESGCGGSALNGAAGVVPSVRAD